VGDVKKVRRKNAIGALPPAVASVSAAVSQFSMVQRKVTKNGAISIASLRQGSKVNVLQIDELTFIVSGRPEAEVQELAATLPVQAPSPFAALSEKLRGKPHSGDPMRIRHAFTGDIEVPSVDDETALAVANIRRAQRAR